MQLSTISELFIGISIHKVGLYKATINPGLSDCLLGHPQLMTNS